MTPQSSKSGQLIRLALACPAAAAAAWAYCEVTGRKVVVRTLMLVDSYVCHFAGTWTLSIVRRHGLRHVHGMASKNHTGLLGHGSEFLHDVLHHSRMPRRHPRGDADFLARVMTRAAHVLSGPSVSPL